jgi:hypothetical protein
LRSLVAASLTRVWSVEQELKTHDGWVMTDWNEDAFRQKAIEAIR